MPDTPDFPPPISDETLDLLRAMKQVGANIVSTDFKNCVYILDLESTDKRRKPSLYPIRTLQELEELSNQEATKIGHRNMLGQLGSEMHQQLWVLHGRRILWARCGGVDFILTPFGQQYVDMLPQSRAVLHFAEGV